MTTNLAAEQSVSASHLKRTSSLSSSSSEAGADIEASQSRSIQEDAMLRTEEGAVPIKRAPLSKNMKWIYAFFTLNYFILGLGAAYELVSALYLTGVRDLSESTVSLGLGIARIPILGRILIGILGDRHSLFNFGHRKPYIILGIVLTSLMYLALGILEINNAEFEERGNFATVYFALYFFLQLTTTIQDAAGDGFLTETIPSERAGSVQGCINCGRGFGAVIGVVAFGFIGDSPASQYETIPSERAGSVQGCINCGRGFGAVIGFVAFGFIGDGPGWQYVHFTLAVCVLAHVPFAFLLQEVPEDQREHFQWRAFEIFKAPKIQVACVFVFLLNIPSAMALFYLPLWIEDGLGFNGDLSGIILAISAVFVALGAPMAGYLLDRYRGHLQWVFTGFFQSAEVHGAGNARYLLDRYRGHLQWVFTGAIVFGAVACAGFIVADLNRDVIYICALLGGAFVGAMLALVFSLTMLLADDAIAGSFFAILDCIWTLGEIVALTFAGALLSSVGFVWSWAITCFLLFMLIPIVHLLFKLPDEAKIEQGKPYDVFDTGYIHAWCAQRRDAHKGFVWSWAITCFLLFMLIPIVHLLFKLPDGPGVDSPTTKKDFEVEDVEFDDIDGDKANGKSSSFSEELQKGKSSSADSSSSSSDGLRKDDVAAVVVAEPSTHSLTDAIARERLKDEHEDTAAREVNEDTDSEGSEANEDTGAKGNEASEDTAGADAASLTDDSAAIEMQGDASPRSS